MKWNEQRQSCFFDTFQKEFNHVIISLHSLATNHHEVTLQKSNPKSENENEGLLSSLTFLMPHEEYINIPSGTLT